MQKWSNLFAPWPVALQLTAEVSQLLLTCSKTMASSVADQFQVKDLHEVGERLRVVIRFTEKVALKVLLFLFLRKGCGTPLRLTNESVRAPSMSWEGFSIGRNQLTVPKNDLCTKRLSPGPLQSPTYPYKHHADSFNLRVH